MSEVANLTLLAIDAGNTRIKWGLFDANGNLLKTGACLHVALAEENFPKATKVLISNVAGKEVADIINNQFKHHADIEWIISKQNACGVFNCYDMPNQLGTDRWAALVGAWYLKKSSCIVVNAGTAVTIDALIAKQNGAEFVGGVILPGIQLMQKSLHLATAQLPKIIKNTQTNLPLFFGRNTIEAIQCGSLVAILGAIDQLHSAVKKETQQAPMIILSGGDATLINKQLSKDKIQNTVNYAIETIEHVVLHGLFGLSNIMQSGAQ